MVHMVQRIPNFSDVICDGSDNNDRELELKNCDDNKGKKDEEEKDVIIDVLGEIGRYQLVVGVLFALLELPHAWCMLLHKFISPDIKHWCAPPPGLNWTQEEWKNYSSPAQDSCHVYNRSYDLDLGPFSPALQTPDSSLGLVECTSWQYDETQFQATIMQKWDLVCSKKFLPNIASFVYFAGTGVGVFLSGLMADKLGRRKVILFFMTTFMLSGLASAFSPIFELWLAFRFLWGASSLGLRAVKTVMSLEMVGSSWRAVVCVGFIEGGWTTGYLTLPLVSWLLPNAFHLQLATSLIMFPFIFLAYNITESPRWLLATNRTDQARQAINKILRFNSNIQEFSLPDDKVITEAPKGATILDLFRTAMLRRTTIVMSMAWFALGMLYFGLSLHMPEFDANIYLIFFLSGLVEIPANVIPFILLNRMGRRPNIAAHYIIGGLLCMATAAVPLGYYVYEWPIVVLAMCGKYIAQACWGIVYLYTNELFPTVVRSAALSFTCAVARLGSMAAPFIASLGHVDAILPIFVFGSITFVAGLQTILLPETNKKFLPNTLEEGESFLQENNPIKLDCCVK